MASSQKKPARTVAAAALNVLWPDQYSGEVPGLPPLGAQFESGLVREFPSSAACWMAVVGRQWRKRNFVITVGATVPDIAILVRVNRRAISGRDNG
jgi:hypothetical protein